MRKLKFVTTNPNKFLEAANFLAEIELERVDRAYTEVQADTLNEVVKHGLRELADQGFENFFIEDAGLFIHSLKGFPGVYSAYVNRTIGCNGILKLAGNNRKAEFRSVVGLYLDKKINLFEGVCEGEISGEKRGKSGFGYDPIFIPENETKTFAEMEIKEKNSYSHRARALVKIFSYLNPG